MSQCTESKKTHEDGVQVCLGGLYGTGRRYPSHFTGEGDLQAKNPDNRTGIIWIQKKSCYCKLHYMT